MLVTFVQFACLALAVTAGMVVWFAIDQGEDPDRLPSEVALDRALEEWLRDYAEASARRGNGRG